MLIYILLFLYFSFLIVLIGSYFILKSDYQKILGMMSFELEKIGYLFINQVLSSKIYKYDEAIKVLFANRKNFINGNHYTISDFEKLYNNYIQDIKYLEKLTNHDFFSDFDIPFEESKIIQNYLVAVRNFLKIFTIGVAGLFIRGKKIY